ncbi:MAG: GlcNAc-PI de-N-acetylase, partial [SAR202 cluster bacterium]|nr:GlcNAc-PI de-N-acetylase [SAR202 cluster bacterium]
MPSQLPLIAIFAHPDDESFTCGGTMALYVSRGAPVYIVCATRGEVGEISDPKLATPETLGQVREQELRNAAAIVGATDVSFLGYRDSGMRGTRENGDPRALHQAPAARVVEQLVSVIRRTRPGVIITFDESGGYGHPDHVAIHFHTTAAYWAAGRRDSFPEHFSQGLETWQTPKLYYTASPRTFWQGLIQAAIAAGMEPPAFLRRRGAFGTPDEHVTTRLDVSSFVETKQRAVLAHATQIQPTNPFTSLPRDLRTQYQGVEHFQRVFPYPRAGEHE